MLNYAEAMWDQTSPYQLTSTDAQNGFSVQQKVKVPAVCNGSESTNCHDLIDWTDTWSVEHQPATTAGAVFAVSVSIMASTGFLALIRHGLTVPSEIPASYT